MMTETQATLPGRCTTRREGSNNRIIWQCPRPAVTWGTRLAPWLAAKGTVWAACAVHEKKAAKAEAERIASGREPYGFRAVYPDRKEATTV